MKKSRLVTICCLAFMAVLFTTACTREDENPLVGKWAYIYEKETPAFVVKSSGKAILDGVEYKYEDKGGFISLDDGNGNVTDLRYEFDKDQLLLYKRSTYFRESDEASGLVGFWRNENGSWSFEFTEEGTFREDEIFQGYYFVQDDGKSIKLAYNDHFVDSYIYYELSGNVLSIEYPWQFVAAE